MGTDDKARDFSKSVPIRAIRGLSDRCDWGKSGSMADKRPRYDAQGPSGRSSMQPGLHDTK
jgi:hypothetical protein